jgi:hypothetical protein
MKKKAAFLLFILAACGGNYSNEDVEFLGALPVRSELESKLPQQAVQSGVTGTRQDALALGAQSTAYTDARAASNAFNSGLFWLLNLIDQIRLFPPTRREPDRRIWGPFPDHDHPGFIDEVVMERQEPALFNYRIEVRRQDDPPSAPWIPLVVGSFRGTGGARKGTGEIHLLAATARAGGFPTGTDLDTVQTIDMSYVTDRSPIEVNMAIQGTPDAGYQTVSYAYAEYSDHHGSIQFAAKATDTQGNQYVLSETAQWLPSGQGRSDITVQAGPFFGTIAVECWDAQFLITYASKPWETPPVVGNAASCAL